MPNRVADTIACQLKAAGIERIFSLSGNQIMSLYDALIDVGIDIVHVRHEAAAVHMADAWAQVTGSPGVALVTAGPGHANAISALYTARAQESPIIMLSGHAPTTLLGKGAFQEMDQSALAAPVTKAAWTPGTVEAMVDAVPTALALCASGRPGPVQLSLPVNLLEGPAPDGTSDSDDTARNEAQRSDTASGGSANPDISALLDALSHAEHPLVAAGPAAMRGHSADALVQLRALGLPVLRMESPRGLRDPAAGALAEVLPDVDLLILAEKALDFTLGFGAAPAFSEQVKVFDIQPDQALLNANEQNAGPRLAGFLKCKAADVANALAATAPAAKPTRAAWYEQVTAAAAYRPDAWLATPQPADKPMHPAHLFAAVRERMEAAGDWTLIADGGEVGQWAQACLDAPVRLINGVAGAIGAGVPYGIAAQMGRPDVPAVAIVGDGTFGFHLAELDTAARYQVPLTVLVCNDARWNAEHQIQLNSFGENRLIGCELQATHYGDVTAPFGVHGEHVATAGAFADAFARAVAHPGPSVVNVVLDGQAAPAIKRG